MKWTRSLPGWKEHLKKMGRDGSEPGYKQTEVGVIPEEWEVEAVVDLSQICHDLRLMGQTVRQKMR